MKVTELKLDEKNANKGTKRGLKVLDNSLRQYGAGRSVLLDKNNKIIAGNKTVERAVDIGIEDVTIIESDGTKLVAVKRTDLDLDSEDGRARALATYDNRVGQLDLDWDLEALKEVDSKIVAELWNSSERGQMEVQARGQEKGEEEISPELLERHDYIVFYFENELDWNVIEDIFDLKPVRCPAFGGSTLDHVGLGRVIKGEKLLEIINAIK